MESLHTHLHIALPGGEPHFADQNVVQFDPAVPGNRDPLRVVASRRSFQHHLPAAVGAAPGGSLNTPRSSDFHRCMRLGPAPEFGLGILLQHHIVADDLRKCDLRGGGPCRGKRNG